MSYHLLQFDKHKEQIGEFEVRLVAAAASLGPLISARLFENLNNGTVCAELVSVGDDEKAGDKVTLFGFVKLGELEGLINLHLDEVKDEVKFVSVLPLQQTARALAIVVTRGPSSEPEKKARKNRKADAKSDS